VELQGRQVYRLPMSLLVRWAFDEHSPPASPEKCGCREAIVLPMFYLGHGSLLVNLLGAAVHRRRITALGVLLGSGPG
jgi:hypothetical protein